jgi:multiple sugar transport system substrate-binding protein
MKKLIVLLLVLAVLAGCARPSPTPVIQTVEVEKIVKETVETEKIVKETVQVEKVVTATPAPEPTPEPVTIRMHHWGTPEQTALHEAEAARFKEIYPWITVEIEAVPVDQYFVKLLTDVAAGTAPDVIMCNASAQVDILTEIFIPLDDFMNDPRAPLYKKDYLDSVWFYNERDGKTWSIPIDFVTRSVYYNKDIFDAAGVPYPDNDWTWPEFVEIADQLTQDTDGDGLVDIIGFDLSISGPHEWYMWFLSAGGDIVDLDTKTAVFNSQAGLDAVQLYLDAAKGYEIGPNPLGLATDVGYISGKAAMIVALPVARVILPTLGQTNFGVARMPKHPDHPRANMAAGETLGISPNSEHPWEAWLWIQYVMQYEEQVEFAKMGFAFPALKSAILDLDVTDPLNEAFWLDAQNNEYYKMFYHKANDIDRLVGEMLQEALLTHTEAGFDLQALLDEYAEEGTAILQED